MITFFVIWYILAIVILYFMLSVEWDFCKNKDWKDFYDILGSSIIFALIIEIVVPLIAFTLPFILMYILYKVLCDSVKNVYKELKY